MSNDAWQPLCPWLTVSPLVSTNQLPTEVWDHVLKFVDDDRVLASLVATSRLLWHLSARPRRRLAHARWQRAQTLMGRAVDAWQVQTAIDWRPRHALEECQSPLHTKHTTGDDNNVMTHPLGAWVCERGLPGTSADPLVICGACARAVSRILCKDSARWPLCRIDHDAPYVGTWDHRLYATGHWWRSHALVDGVEFVVPPPLVEWADCEAAAALADRWRHPARYGLAADTDRRPLNGMLVLDDGLAPSRMGSVRGWLPVAWRRIRIAWAHSGRLLWGAQFVLVCCDRTSPHWGAGVLIEQNATLAMGRWALATDDLAAFVSQHLPQVVDTAGVIDRHDRVTTDDVPSRWRSGEAPPDCDSQKHIVVGALTSAHPLHRPTKAMRHSLVAMCLKHACRATQEPFPSPARSWSRVLTLSAPDDKDEQRLASVETHNDTEDGSFWHCPLLSYPHDRHRAVYADTDQNGRRGLFW